MKTLGPSKVLWLAALAVAGAAGCGGDDDSGNNPRIDAAVMIDAAETSTSQTVGAAGGTVTVPNGPTVTVPAGALSMDVTITITATDTFVQGAVSGVWKFEPEGLTFAIP